MEAILLALSPFVVNAVTQGIKKLQTIEMAGNRVAVVRFIAAVFSFVAVLLGGLATGEMIDQNVIVTFVETALVFIASQVTYYLAKRGAQ
jgi:hypothetical protein